MSKKHLIICDDGHVLVTQVLEGGTLKESIANIVAYGLNVASVEEVEATQIPTDRTFRNAWRHCGKNGTRIDMASAREIQRDKLRARRAERFTQTDVATWRGLSENRDVSAVANMAARLRDVTKHPAIEAAETVEDLKKVWPSVLEEPVPELGGPRISGDADYDTKALEEWAKSLTDQMKSQTEKIAALEAQRMQAASVDLSPIERKLAELDEKLASGADMKDLQEVRQAVQDLREGTRILASKVLDQEDNLEWLEKNTAHKDLYLTKDVVKQ